MYAVGESYRAFVACRHGSEIFASIEWKFTQNSVRGSIAVDFADQSPVQQSNPLHNEPVALVPQKDFAPS